MRIWRAFPALLLLAVQPACKPMLYPVARAFGSPSEGELKLRRAAFARLQAQHGSAAVLVPPAVDPRRTGTPFPESAARLADLLREGGWKKATPSLDPPAVPATPLGRNQLRYLQTRARAYAEWVKRTGPQASFIVQVEILSFGPGRIDGIHCVVVEVATGTVAFAHLQNSHHFGPTPPADADQACRRAVQFLLQALKKRAEQVHPPWGIG